MNSVDSEQYGKLMRIDPAMHAEMLDFIKKAKHFSKIQLTIVGLNEVDSEQARKLATYELGVEFRERKYF